MLGLMGKIDPFAELAVEGKMGQVDKMGLLGESNPSAQLALKGKMGLVDKMGLVGKMGLVAGSDPLAQLVL